METKDRTKFRGDGLDLAKLEKMVKRKKIIWSGVAIIGSILIFINEYNSYNNGKSLKWIFLHIGLCLWVIGIAYVDEYLKWKRGETVLRKKCGWYKHMYIEDLDLFKSEIEKVKTGGESELILKAQKAFEDAISTQCFYAVIFISIYFFRMDHSSSLLMLLFGVIFSIQILMSWIDKKINYGGALFMETLDIIPLLHKDDELVKAVNEKAEEVVGNLGKLGMGAILVASFFINKEIAFYGLVIWVFTRGSIKSFFNNHYRSYYLGGSCEE